MNIKRRSRATWILIFFSYATFIMIEPSLSLPWGSEGLFALFFFSCFIIGIIAIIFLNTIRTKLPEKHKRLFLILLVFSGILYLFFDYLVPLDEVLEFDIGYAILMGIGGTFIFSSIYGFTCYLHQADNIFLGLLTIILISLVLNRFGVEGAGFIVGFCFFLTFYGFLFLAITHSMKSKSSKHFRRIISTFCYVICFIFLLLFFKFSSGQPAFTKYYDTIGVITFLLASIALFISMPFSNFIEWLKTQRQLFYKVILLPFLFFLIVFSLRFLLPDSTYRSIFFIEFSKKEKVHFWMEDYESEID